MARVLITGATGFIGRTAVAHLAAKGLQVWGCSRHPQAVEEALRGQAKGWLALKEVTAEAMAEAGITHLIHLAGLAHDLAGRSQEQDYFAVNRDLTFQLFEAFAQSPHAKAFVYFSSVKAVADTVSGSLVEDAPPQPATAYGRSKLAAEQGLLQRAQRANLDLYLLRPAMVYGPGNKGNLAELAKMVARGVPIPLGAFRNQRSFVAVDNVVYGLNMAVAGRLAPGTYHLADQTPLSTAELVHTMAKAMGRRPRLWAWPRWTVRAIARVGDVLPIPLDSHRLRKLTESYVVDSRRWQQALPGPLPTDSPEGIYNLFAHGK